MSHSRVCKVCLDKKSSDDFYDSNLSTCKKCIIVKSKLQTAIKTSTPEGLKKERERHRDKYRRLGYKEQQKEWDKDKPWKDSNTYKGLRKKHHRDLPREFELHHWNYNDEYLLDVFILNIKDHKNLHNSLFLNLEKRIFYLEDGTELDTKEKHLEYINKLGIIAN